MVEYKNIMFKLFIKGLSFLMNDAPDKVISESRKLQLLTPNEKNITYNTGQPGMEITWKGKGGGKYIRISLLKGDEEEVITSETGNDGRYHWDRVWDYAETGNNYKIKLAYSDGKVIINPELSDVSDNAFTINKVRFSSILVLKPDGRDYRQTHQIPIVWRWRTSIKREVVIKVFYNTNGEWEEVSEEFIKWGKLEINAEMSSAYYKYKTHCILDEYNLQTGSYKFLIQPNFGFGETYSTSFNYTSEGGELTRPKLTIITNDKNYTYNSNTNNLEVIWKSINLGKRFMVTFKNDFNGETKVKVYHFKEGGEIVIYERGVALDSRFNKDYEVRNNNYVIQHGPLDLPKKNFSIQISSIDYPEFTEISYLYEGLVPLSPIPSMLRTLKLIKPNGRDDIYVKLYGTLFPDVKIVVKWVSQNVGNHFRITLLYKPPSVLGPTKEYILSEKIRGRVVKKGPNNTEYRTAVLKANLRTIDKNYEKDYKVRVSSIDYPEILDESFFYFKIHR